MIDKSPRIDKSMKKTGMKKADRYLKIVEWSDEDQAYVGRAPGLAFGGVHGPEEARVYQELCQLVEEWVEILEKDGAPLPPATAGRSYSGRFNLRVSPELHERLSIESNKIGESLNQYCVRALQEAADPK
jgi:predicted HicB family RNase H-like nuclease